MLSRQEVRDSEPCGILAGHDARTSRRTDRTCSVGVGEAHAAGSELVYFRCFKEAAAVEPDVLPTHVVDEKEYEVGEFRWIRRAKDARGREPKHGAAEEFPSS